MTKQYVILLILLLMILPLTGNWEQRRLWANEQQLRKVTSSDKDLAEGFSGTVTETMNSGGYTYVYVDTGSDKKWAAAPFFECMKGDKVAVPPGLPMYNFQSRSLKRSFELIYFVGGVTKTVGKGASAKPGMPEGHPPIGGNSGPSQVIIGKVDRAKGGKTIADVIATKKAMVGKEVLIRGRVVKFNSNIMGKNWLHIQDGSGSEGSNDLTVTTEAMVKVGDLVLVRGVVSLDRDFGFGYKFSIIIENAKVIVE